MSMPSPDFNADGNTRDLTNLTITGPDLRRQQPDWLDCVTFNSKLLFRLIIMIMIIIEYEMK